MKLLNALLKVSGLTRLSYAKPRHRRLEIMKYLVNKNACYIITHDEIDVQRLQDRGCMFFLTEHDMYHRSSQAPSRGPSFFTRVKAENHVITDRQRDLGCKPRNPVLREVWASGVQCHNRRCVTPFAIGNIRYSKRPKPPSDGVSDTYVCVVTPFAIHLYIVRRRHFRLLHVRNKVT